MSPNRLAQESSPYLLQHKDNPVDWYPWGDEALARSRSEDRPILLSVGYSACHWCHVMERESFEDAEIARLMNDKFVCVKVDREERPDVDDLYMEAVQAMTGHGGWPLTAFLDPDGVPFYGGTYFPPEPRQGMPSFRQVLDAVDDAYRNRRDEIENAAGQIRDGLGAIGRLEPGDEELSAPMLEHATSALLARADYKNGGFGEAPKFPPAAALEYLLARGEHAHVELSLDSMAAGGIYDQLGGGFARYSVDATWLVPHFEKMLYDNALLARCYLHGYQAIGHERYRRICCETLDWALREMRTPEGGFCAALDADSEGVEGRFYVWDADEARDTLAAAGIASDAIDPLLLYLGISEQGNFEGQNVLHLPAGAAAQPPEALGEARAALLERRSKRIRPALDDKQICSWNALMIAALAEAGASLGRDDYLDAARDCAAFVLERMRDGEGRLLRTQSGRILAYLEDHAYLLEALLTLYESTFDPRFFAAAKDLAEVMKERFGDPERGGFFTTAIDAEQLIARRKDLGDHPIPAGNSSAAFGLLRLAALSGDAGYAERAEGVLRLFAPTAVGHAEGFGHMLGALDFHLSAVKEVALVGSAGAEFEELAKTVRAGHRPRLVLAGGPQGTREPALMRERAGFEGKPAAYVCENFTCKQPVTEASELAALL